MHAGKREGIRTELQYSMKRLGSRKEKSKKKKFSFGEKPVRLNGREVEKAEETNKERKTKKGKELGGTAHTWLQMRPQMLRVITDDGK